MGVTIVAASTDTLEQAQEVANTEQGLTYQMAYGVTEEDANTLGSWWSTLSAFGRERLDGYMQPPICIEPWRGIRRIVRGWSCWLDGKR